MFRISLKKFLLVSACLVAVTFAGNRIYLARLQKATVQKIENAGGSIRYDFQLNPDGSYTGNTGPAYLPRIVTDYLGLDLFCHVKEVNLYGHDSFQALKDLDLQGIPQAEIVRMDFIPADLNELVKLPKLKHLRFANKDIPFQALWNPTLQDPNEDQDFSFFQRLPNLVHLQLPPGYLKAIPHLNNCKKLKTLAFSHYSVERRSNYMSWKETNEIEPGVLKSLVLNILLPNEETGSKNSKEIEMRDAVEDSLAGMKNLEFLRLHYKYQPVRLSKFVPNLPKLKTLIAESDHDVSLETFTSCPNLIALEITAYSENATIRQFDQIYQIPKIERISLHGFKTGPIPQLSQHPSLKSLYINGTVHYKKN